MAASLPRSPLAPEKFPDLPEVAGVRLATRAAGLRYKGRDDLLLAVLPEGTRVAGTLTRSATAAPPVLWCREALRAGNGRALVVNAGNANAFTGKAGTALVERTVGAAAEHLGCPPDQVFVASTGTIGEKLAADAIASSLPPLFDDLGQSGWQAAARAIMTTDTFPKGAGARVSHGDGDIAIAGIAKGSGMIAPDMATMLAFIFTDAPVAPSLLDRLVKRGVNRSFNRISVDSDTSTSDTVLVFATGKAGGPPIEDAASGRGRPFAKALEEVMTDLARQVVRDGVGASKFVTVTVRGALSRREAETVARAIADSPLVKTAIAGEDANWGRIVMAVGKSGARVERDRLSVAMGGITIAAEGEAVPGYDEAPVAAHMRGQEIEILVDLGLGAGEAVIWTCDLTEAYIRINAGYRS